MTLAYSQISDTLSENLLVCGCKYNAFFSILQLFKVFFIEIMLKNLYVSLKMTIFAMWFEKEPRH